jgi:pimeloyl-ACP methyl ester carboxylesterase
MSDVWAPRGPLSTVTRVISWSVMLKLVSPRTARHMLGDIPAERRGQLLVEVRDNDPRFLARWYHRYLAYMDQYGSLVARLRDSRARALIVFAAHDHVGLTEQERLGLESCPRVALRTLPDTGHMVPMERPALIAELIAETFSNEGWAVEKAA